MGTSFYKAYARAVIVQEFDASALQRFLHVVEGAGLGVDGIREGFHAADGSDSNPSRLGELCLIPSEQCSGRPQLSAVRELQERKVAFAPF